MEIGGQIPRVALAMDGAFSNFPLVWEEGAERMDGREHRPLGKGSRGTPLRVFFFLTIGISHIVAIGSFSFSCTMSALHIFIRSSSYPLQWEIRVSYEPGRKNKKNKTKIHYFNAMWRSLHGP